MSAVLASEPSPPQVGPGFLADRYPTYRAWRDAGLLHWSTGNRHFGLEGGCVVTARGLLIASAPWQAISFAH